jgi:hypothetical protein
MMTHKNLEIDAFFLDDINHLLLFDVIVESSDVCHFTKWDVARRYTSSGACSPPLVITLKNLRSIIPPENNKSVS